MRAVWQQTVSCAILQWYEAPTARKQWQTTGLQCLENHNTAGMAGK
jgi:hypothetical protein